MSTVHNPSNIIIINIDGLRQDVFHHALEDGSIPNLAHLVGQGIHVDPLSTAPSVTYCAQTTLFTGVQPGEHGVVGNEFFDRFGLHNNHIPRYYALDVGDTLAIDDAVNVFHSERGLLNDLLSDEIPTLYELAGGHGMRSLVAHHMLSRGATDWLRPGYVNSARFLKGGLLGLDPWEFDHEMIHDVVRTLKNGIRPDLITVYFMGLDHHAHIIGPETQAHYLSQYIDPQIGALMNALDKAGLLTNTLVSIASDHGQIRVISDDAHSLRISFPFDREMGYLFEALHLDIHDFPGEDPNCDAVVGSNGGMAYVYIQKKSGRWNDAPSFTEDILPVAQAFWEANLNGRYAPDLQEAIAAILVRDVEHEGWQADYQVYDPIGLIPLDYFCNNHAELSIEDGPARVKLATCALSGDIQLISNYEGKYYFSKPYYGMHGGLHRDDSRSVLSFGWTGATTPQLKHLHKVVKQTTQERRRIEGRSANSLGDMVHILKALLNW